MADGFGIFAKDYIAQGAELQHWHPPCSEASPLADGFGIFAKAVLLRGLNACNAGLNLKLAFSDDQTADGITGTK